MPPQKRKEERKIAHKGLENRFTPDEAVAISRKSPPELSCSKVCRPTRAGVYSKISPSGHPLILEGRSTGCHYFLQTADSLCFP